MTTKPGREKKTVRSTYVASVTLDDADAHQRQYLCCIHAPKLLCERFISKSHVRLSAPRYNPSHNESSALSGIIRGGMLSCALSWQQFSSYSYICHVK